MIGKKVPEFLLHLVHGPTNVDSKLISSDELLQQSKKPTVIQFYSGGLDGCRPCAAQMETWAKAIPQVQFLCICVDNIQVATAFHYMIQFQHVVNAVISSKQFRMYGYGQLGCFGFVVIDKDGHFVSLKTKAYLECGKHAFKHVDAILATTLLEDDDGEQHDEENKDEEDFFKQPIPYVASTGIITMDQKHEAYTDAMNDVVSNPSSRAA
jgi:hypothetical protein